MKVFALFLLLQLSSSQNSDVQLVQTAAPHSPAGFPTLAELERMLPEAPELRAIRVEPEKQKLQQRWDNQITLHANYSQHFSSFVPFVPTPDVAIAGGTFVGVSVSVKLSRLLSHTTPEMLDQELKVLEYERIYQQKLAALRLLYRRRSKLLYLLETLAAQKRTANLQLEKIRIGLELMKHVYADINDPANSSSPIREAAPLLAFDPIDLAEAEEKAIRLENERRQTGLEIENLQTEIWALVGKGQVTP